MRSRAEGRARDGAAGGVPADPRFANYRLPAAPVPPSNYVVTGALVSDVTTGLSWERGGPSPTLRTQAQSSARCASLTSPSADWRLPTRIEVLTISDPGAASTGAFWPGVTILNLPNLWTSTPNGAGSHVVILLQSSTTVTDADTMTNASLCVRGGPTTTPANRYVVAGGVVSDVLTHLDWQRTPSSSLVALDAAGCASVGLPGTGWRVPNIRELASLLDEARPSPPLIAPTFDAGPSAPFWASTSIGGGTLVHLVRFDTGEVNLTGDTVTPRAIRCVRTAP